MPQSHLQQGQIYRYAQQLVLFLSANDRLRLNMFLADKDKAMSLPVESWRRSAPNDQRTKFFLYLLLYLQYSFYLCIRTICLKSTLLREDGVFNDSREAARAGLSTVTFNGTTRPDETGFGWEKWSET